MEKQNVISAFSALAHETRLDIYRLLVEAGPEGVAAGEVATALGVPSATMSFHLKELKSAMVISCRREGRSLIYSPNFTMMDDLTQYLTENCCGGTQTCEPGFEDPY